MRIVKQFEPAIPLLIIPLLFASPCPAGEVPESAFSRSMSTRPELLDHVTLAYVFPQIAAEWKGGLYAGNDWSSGTGPSLGLIGRAASHALFFMAQATPDYNYGADELYQAGWGASWNAVRFGAAVRGTRTNEDVLNSRDRLDTEELYIDTRSSRQKMLEGAVGIGYRTGRVDMDFALELLAQERTWYYFEQNSRDTLYTDFHDSGDPSLGFKGRVVFRPARKVECVLAGGWSKPKRDFGGIATMDTVTFDLRKAVDLDRWFGGLAFTFPTSRIDRVTISSMVRVIERESFGNSYWTPNSITEYRDENLWIAAAVEHEVFSDFVFRSGLEWKYARQERIQTINEYNRAETEADQKESMDKHFAWGGTYRWRDFELTGSASTLLSLDNLFIALDARLIF